MRTTATQPVPKDLREQMIQRMQLAPDEDILFAYEIMLIAEKARPWKEIQNDAIQEAAAGKHDNLPEWISQYRQRNRQSA
jgi:hypothetical protein